MNYVRNDCKVFRFCSSKCHKNFKLKRTPRKTRWTKTFRRAAGKELTMDTTLEFERKRNVPVKYNRDLVGTTLRAMVQVEAIRAKREKLLFEKRMKRRTEANTTAGIKELGRRLHWIEDPAQRESVEAQVKEAEKLKAEKVVAKRAEGSKYVKKKVRVMKKAMKSIASSAPDMADVA